MSSRALKIAGLVTAALALLVVLFVMLFDWNWLRGPIERKTLEVTGRVLAIKGRLSVRLAWPAPRLRVEQVTFANPAWAKQAQMFSVDAAELTLDLLELLRRNYVLSEVRLDRATVFLETSADGRRNWLLDLEQKVETARVRIGRLRLDHARLGYDDAAENTSISAEFSSRNSRTAAGAESGLVFTATGRYKGEPMNLSGSGGPVIALADEDTPYPLTIAGNFGRTTAHANGTVTSLLKFTAMDVRLDLRGDSLDHLFPLIGIALPKTAHYSASGHLTHGGDHWRYQDFSGHIGSSDIAGTLQVDIAGDRPFLHGNLVSKQLALDDLGPPIGIRAARTGLRVLPDVPFSAKRWDSVDADVRLNAVSIRSAAALPFDHLNTRIRMTDSVLKLDPLEFGLAGGKLAGIVVLDGRQDQIHARASIRAGKIQLPKLFPTLALAKTSIGQIDGEFDLAGEGNSVDRMLGSSNGKVGLVIDGGEISNLMLERIGLDLYEMAKFKLHGDQTISIRCGVADFGVQGGIMRANALVFDTVDTNVGGAGSIDLRAEALDLTFEPQPKDKSPVALRAPLHVRGMLAKPVVSYDARIIAARGVASVALGFVNPLLAIIPLIETGPGRDSNCGQLIREAKATPAAAK